MTMQNYALSLNYYIQLLLDQEKHSSYMTVKKATQEILSKNFGIG